jgi:hypothetical protein
MFVCLLRLFACLSVCLVIHVSTILCSHRYHHRQYHYNHDSVQLNAYPPKPKVNVDLYKSTAYGDPGVLITLIVKTSSTLHNEIPNMHVELFLALNQS